MQEHMLAVFVLQFLKMNHYILIIVTSITNRSKGWKLDKKILQFAQATNKRTVITFICDALRDLVLFVQFKKREKHPWRSVIFS